MLIERDRFAAECARKALRRPANAAFSGRVKVVETDIATRDGLADGIASAAVFNPPFYAKRAASASPALSRAEAHILGDGGLDPWFRAAAALVRPGGTAAIVFRADGLDLILAAARGRFGALDILPIVPRPGAVAHRILVRGVKGSRAAMRILESLVLHPSDSNRFRPEIDGILRGAADIASVAPTWNERRDHSF